MREFFSSTKPDDLKSKDRKMNCTQSETCVIARRSNIISPADAITEWAKRASENSPNKEKIKKDPRIINEVMPKAFRTGRYCALSEQSCKISHSKSATKEPFEVKYHLINLLLGSQSFCNQAHGLYGTSTIHQTWCHHQTSNQHKLSTDFLLLDCAEEMIRKGHEMKLSLGQMLRKHTESQSSHQFLIALVEDISSGMKKLASYADEFAFCEESLNNMLAKDLQCNERMLNAIWDDGWDYWIVTDEGDEVVFELEEKLIAGLLVEIVKDLIFYGARRLSWE
ncbi:hypothetical protein AXF42_Ash020356 [Apostasia shenzhenica]|uniref:DUF4378 domain-containing protein n=1 Tax=Apostasia shenzhenica TaxID=1088818 RepID=A0A2I0BAB0_9ASPA|nr:hypothetical protein AXF42_Ash020356 [Apostasia shenzhenica]